MKSKSEVNLVKLAVVATGLSFFGVDAYPALQQSSGAQFQSFNDTPAGMQPFVEPEVPGNASINTTDLETSATQSTVTNIVVYNDTNSTILKYALGISGAACGVGLCLALLISRTGSCSTSSENDQFAP